MKLYYFTKVDLSLNSASAIQIKSMCRAFSCSVEDFTLVTPVPKNKINTCFKWDKTKAATRFIYLEFVLRSYLKALIEKPTHAYTRNIVVAFFLSFLNIKVAYEAHKDPRTIVAKILMRLLRRKRNFFLIAISRALRDFYIEEYHFEYKSVLGCHDGVFIEDYDVYRGMSKCDLRSTIGLPIDRMIVMHTGGMHKGRDAELFRVIVDNFKDLLFVQVGGSSSDVEKYKQFYKNYENIVFIPSQSREMIIKYQMSADLLFYALTKNNDIHWCTSPLKVFEYMATGVPILGSSIGSVKEVLNNQNSIPFSPEDESSIIDGVNFFLRDKSRAEQVSHKALMEVRGQYSWEARVKNIIHFLR